MGITRVVVDPVTRIEGHLRVEAMLDGHGNVTDAISSGTMWRGIELILQGRDPREAWAFCERICGVCTTVHAVASVRAVENALGIRVPPNAEIIRNIMFLAQFLQDHVVHFYHLHALDWVDLVSSLGASPAATEALQKSISPGWPNSSAAYFAEVQAKVKKFVDSGQLGIFGNAYWGHPAYKLPPEGNLLAVAHYFEALQWQKEIVKIHAMFGGKNPHPHYQVGGMASILNPTGDEHTLNTKRLNSIGTPIQNAIDLVEGMYLPDLQLLASFYPEWSSSGGGLGNFMAYGDVPRNGIGDPSGFRFPRGAILGGSLGRALPLDLSDPNQIREQVAHSWYDYPAGQTGLHPLEGVTAPRWRGKTMEVGPLARGLKTRLCAQWLKAEYEALMENVRRGVPATADTRMWDPASWPGAASGSGFTEAPRGACGHWIWIREGKISQYQIVVPSTWNAAFKDGFGNTGPYESALIGATLADPARPLGILRTIHSFYPCLACATHVVSPEGRTLAEVEVR